MEKANEGMAEGVNKKRWRMEKGNEGMGEGVNKKRWRMEKRNKGMAKWLNKKRWKASLNLGKCVWCIELVIIKTR